jgi:hypothetical protein
MVRGQQRAGEDMRARLADDIDLVMRAEQLVTCGRAGLPSVVASTTAV